MSTQPSVKARGMNLQWIGLVILAAIAAWPWFSGPFALHLAVLTCLNVLVVNGLAIIARTGQLSFGHAAFAAIGAYAAVILSISLRRWPGLPSRRLPRSCSAGSSCA